MCECEWECEVENNLSKVWVDIHVFIIFGKDPSREGHEWKLEQMIKLRPQKGIKFPTNKSASGASGILGVSGTWVRIACFCREVNIFLILELRWIVYIESLKYENQQHFDRPRWKYCGAPSESDETLKIWRLRQLIHLKIEVDVPLMEWTDISEFNSMLPEIAWLYGKLENTFKIWLCL
jgi:hypothetical protein